MTSFDDLFRWVHPVSFNKSSIRAFLSDGTSWLDLEGLDQDSVTQLVRSTSFCARDLANLFPDLGRFGSQRLVQILADLGAIEPVPQEPCENGVTTMRVAVVGKIGTATRFANQLNLVPGVTAGVSGEGRFPYWVDLTSTEADLVIVVAETAEIDRGISNTLVQGRALQLPVVVTANQIILGPLISPGSSACLGCLDHQLAATDSNYLAHLARNVLTDSKPSSRELDIALRMVLDEVSRCVSSARSGLINRRLIKDLELDIESTISIKPHPVCFCHSREQLSMAS